MRYTFLTTILALLTPVLSSPGWQYTGCIDGSTVLSTFSLLKFDHPITPDECTYECEAEHYSYAALSDGMCYCGSMLSTPPTLLYEQFCSTPCVADPALFCGGDPKALNSPVALYKYAGTPPSPTQTTAGGFMIDVTKSNEFTAVQTSLDSTQSALLNLLLPKPTAIIFGLINTIPAFAGVGHDVENPADAARPIRAKAAAPAAGMNATSVANLASAVARTRSASLKTFSTSDGKVAAPTSHPPPKFQQFSGAIGRSVVGMVILKVVGAAVGFVILL